MKSVVLEKVTSLNHQASEAYKSLRSNIEFCGDDVRVIAVTSCLPNDGKSSTAFNLAKSMAENGDKVLFIDADLRKSVMVGRYKATVSFQEDVLLMKYCTVQISRISI